LKHKRVSKYVNKQTRTQANRFGWWTFHIKHSSKHNQLFLHCWRW